MTKSTINILSLSIILFFAPLVIAGQATLSWVPPVTNEDGTPLTDLTGYVIYYGMAPGSYSENINVGNVTSYTVDRLKHGHTYFFTVTAYDTSFNQSRYSNIASKSIPMPERYSLSISKLGTGNGTITSTPMGINCGSLCEFSYPIRTEPTKVTLKATVDSNSYFVGWEGACGGSNPTCTLTIENDLDVVAIFRSNPLLTITKSGDGKGNIVATPAGVNCGVDCSSYEAHLKHQVKVTLKAKTDEYSTFLGWGGDCEDQGSHPACTLRMDGDKHVDARFGLPKITVTQDEHYFGSVEIKESSIPVTVTLYNTGIGNLKIRSVRLIGSDKKMFKVVGDKKTMIPPGDRYEYIIFFKPSSTGFKEAVLAITSNDPDSPLAEVILTGFGCTERTDVPRVKKCSGTLARCLSMQCGWEFDGMAVGDAEFRGISIIRLPDGRYRMYGNYVSAPGLIDSWISADGVVFEKEPGSRFFGQGGIWPSLVTLPDGRFRMYYAEHSSPSEAYGASAIKSAISADGLHFVVEDGIRLEYLANEYESYGLVRPRVVSLEDGSYRMYYGALSNDVHRILSAVSSDGLTWVREYGVRFDPRIVCPAATRLTGSSDLFVDENGIFHHYLWIVKCKDQYYKDAVAGLFEFTSRDGLTFDISAAPVVAGYYFKDCYRGRLNDPGIRIDNVTLVITPEGLRAYLFTYDPQEQCTAWSGRHFSIINASIR